MNVLEWLYDNEPNVLNDMRWTNHGYYDKPSPYHLEGSVLTHTMMVYNEALKSFEFEVVLLAALLHDYGKVFTKEMDSEKQRTFFKNHEGYSLFASVDIIKKFFGDDKANIVECLFAIANHGFYQQNNITREKVIDKLKIFPNSFLCALHGLIHADLNGRIKASSVRENRLDFDLDYAFDEVVGLDYKKKETSKEFVMMVGLPGSGKSTFIKENLKGYAILSRDSVLTEMYPASSYKESWNIADQKEVDKVFMKLVTNTLNTFDKVVLDMTNLTKKGRKKWLALSNQRGLSNTAYVMATDIRTCFNRRGVLNKDGKLVSDRVIDSMAKKFTFPLGDEFDKVEIFV